MLKMAFMLFYAILVLSLMHYGYGQNQVELQVTTIETEPYFKALDKKVATDIKGEGYVVDLIAALSKKLKNQSKEVRFKIQIVKDGNYGKKVGKNQWTGMMGEVIGSGSVPKADVAIAPLTATADRLEVVDFTGGFMTAPLTIYGKNPPEPKTKDTIFALGVLLVIAGVAAVALFSLCLCFLVNPKEKISNRGVCDRVWYAVTTFLLQGLAQRPKSGAVRILAAFWLVFVLVTVGYYIWALLVQTTEGIKVTKEQSKTGNKMLNFKYVTFDDILKSDYKIYMTGNGSTEAFFRNNDKDIYKRIYSKVKLDNTFVKKIADGVEKVVNSNDTSKNVFIQEKAFSDYYATQNCKTASSMDSATTNQYYGIAMNPNLDSKLEDIKAEINKAVTALRDDGTLTKLYSKWFDVKEGCAKNKADKNVMDVAIYSLKKFLIPPVIFGGGLVLALIVGVIELVMCSGETEDSMGEVEDDHRKQLME